MKKNIMMRLSAVLLVAVLLTTCVISGTWAKYISTGSTDNESVRVAKWGVVITADSVAQDQLEDDLSATETAVHVDGTTDLLAPGTAVKFASIKVSGNAEVAVKITYSADLVLSGWQAAGGEYVPVVFVIDGTSYSADTAAELEEKVEAAIAAFTDEYAAMEDLAGTPDFEIYCKWAFDGDDAKDTELGAAGTATVSLKVSCTVEQIDEFPVAP